MSNVAMSPESQYVGLMPPAVVTVVTDVVTRIRACHGRYVVSLASVLTGSELGEGLHPLSVAMLITERASISSYMQCMRGGET